MVEEEGKNLLNMQFNFLKNKKQNIFEAPKIPSPILASFMFTSTYT